MFNLRESGILMPIFSLPNNLGIGTLGSSAYEFVDFLKRGNQRYWQILPIGPTSYGDSPYQSFSSFAGNPYFIDLEMLVNDGLLTEEDIKINLNDNKYIDYEMLYNTRFITLRKAFVRFNKNEMYKFLTDNAYWVIDYAIFMALKDYHQGASFIIWKNEFKESDKEVLKSFVTTHQEEIEFYEFIQYEFYKQWFKLKEYANKNGVSIIGDMPIYVALDSCDVWKNKKEFQLDENFEPVNVAGCPPDDICPEGQVWGNPLYDWKYMKKNNYAWWTRRLNFAKDIFDVIRIDHFRGFEAYFSIPSNDTTAVNGHWEKGPNYQLFKTIEKKIGKLNIIVENLGFITDEVQDMLNHLEYPGMKVLEFGFSFDGYPLDSTFNLTYNSVVYTTTHDNPPILAWYKEQDKDYQNLINDYLYNKDESQICNILLRRCLDSCCKLSILPMWDLLQAKEEARINTPSTLGYNWKWRINPGDMNNDFSTYLNYLMILYKRNQNN